MGDSTEARSPPPWHHSLENVVAEGASLDARTASEAKSSEEPRVEEESAKVPKPAEEPDEKEANFAEEPTPVNADVPGRISDPRFHFGSGFRHGGRRGGLLVRCSTCRALSLNRGDKDSGKVYCRRCYRSQAMTLAAEGGVAL